MAVKTMTTPKGTAIYPWLTKADEKFGDPTYKCDLLIETGAPGLDEVTAKLEDQLEEYFSEMEEQFGDKYDELIKEELPFFEDEEGIVFRLKLKKFGENKKTGETWENKIAFYDSKGKPVDPKKLPIVGGGSVLRISFSVQPWKMPDSEGRGKNKKTFLKVGLKLNIKAVKVIEANNKATAKSAEDYGFDQEDDGYEYNPDEFDSDDSAGDDADDFL